MLCCKHLSSAKQTSAVESLPEKSVKDVPSALCMGCRARRDFLQKKVFDCEGSLAEAKADRKESERDRKIHEAVTNLKRLFPGMATPRLATALNVTVPLVWPRLANCTWHTLMVAGINYIPAKAKTLPHEGALALVIWPCLHGHCIGSLALQQTRFRPEHARMP